MSAAELLLRLLGPLLVAGAIAALAGWRRARQQRHATTITWAAPVDAAAEAAARQAWAAAYGAHARLAQLEQRVADLERRTAGPATSDAPR